MPLVRADDITHSATLILQYKTMKSPPAVLSALVVKNQSLTSFMHHWQKSYSTSCEIANLLQIHCTLNNLHKLCSILIRSSSNTTDCSKMVNSQRYRRNVSLNLTVINCFAKHVGKATDALYSKCHVLTRKAGSMLVFSMRKGNVFLLLFFNNSLHTHCL